MRIALHYVALDKDYDVLSFRMQIVSGNDGRVLLDNFGAACEAEAYDQTDEGDFEAKRG